MSLHKVVPRIGAASRSLLRSIAFLALATTASPGWAGGMTLAHPYPSGGEVDTWAREFAECVGKEAGIPVEVRSGGELGGAEELRHAVQDGQIDFAVLPVTTMAGSWKELGLLAVPGAVSSPQEIMNLSASQDFVEALDRLGARKNGFHVIALGWQYQTLASNNRAQTFAAGDSHALKDLSGRKIRVTGKGTADFFAKLGGMPVENIPSSEAPFELAFGGIDGAVLSADQAPDLVTKGDPIVMTWSDGYTPLTAPIVVVMSDFSLRGWGEKLLFVRSACAEVTANFNRRAIESATSSVRQAADRGITVQAYDQAAWSDFTKRSYDEAVTLFGAGAIANALAKAKQ